MAKYNIISLKLRNGSIVNRHELAESEVKALRNNNAIYIYRSSRTRRMYVGQTVNFENRHRQHYDGSDEKFNAAYFDEAIVVVSQYFNGTALDDVERQLIQYMLADNDKRSRERFRLDYDEIINKTAATR